MDRLQSMRVFQQVVEEGSFSAAARKLNLAAAGVTRLVGDLEQHLGVRLLQRTTRRLALTAAGEAYLDQVRAILEAIDHAEASVLAHTQQMRGTVRVLAPPVAAAHIVGPAVAGFQRLHPAVVVEVHVEDSPDPAVHDYDLAVLNGGSQVDAGTVLRPLAFSQSVLCAAPDYLARQGEPAAPGDLAQHRCLRLRLPGVRPGPWRLLDPEDGDRVLELEVAAVLSANHTDTLLKATVEGAGISSLPLDLISPLIREGRLRRVLAPWITARLTLVAALPSRKFMPPRTRAFLDHLVAHSRARMAALGIPQP